MWEPRHDFYHLYGKDNIVLFYTDRYPEQPLVIKGAGAGAEVTASGVFADIIRAANANMINDERNYHTCTGHGRQPGLRF